MTNLLYLAQQSEDIAEIRRHLPAAEIELRRVGAITSQTLRFHKQASGPRAITAEDLIASALAIFQGRLSNSQVRVCERYTARKPVRCFEGEIRQVISNLVSNVLDAMCLEGQNSFCAHQACNELGS